VNVSKSAPIINKKYTSLCHLRMRQFKNYDQLARLLVNSYQLRMRQISGTVREFSFN
jgi:hypothetical protein